MKRSIFALLLALFTTSFCFAQSSDLRTYGLLKGKVKRISTSNGEGVAFDKNGKIFSIRIASVSIDGGGGVYGDKIKHDAQGRITHVTYKQEMGLVPTKVDYKYSNGNLASTELLGHEWSTICKYSDYKNGLPYTVELEDAAEAWAQEGTLKITYTKFDAHGNWTECIWKGKVKETEDGGETYETKEYKQTITRKIFYY